MLMVEICNMFDLLIVIWFIKNWYCN